MIHLVHRQFDSQSATAVQGVLDSGWVAMGSMTEKVERRLAEMTGMAHAIATSSCTSALYISFRASLKPGSKVILSPFTFASALHSATLAGMDLLFVDIDIQSGNIAVNALTDSILDKADAILITHYAGIPCSKKVLTRAREHGLRVIDDSAHALGATRIDGAPLQAEADVACLSFNSTKIFSSGEGGAIVTNDGSLADKCRLLRNYGMTKTSAQKAEEGASFDIREISLNFKFNDVLASVLYPQLEEDRYVQLLNRRDAIARAYRSTMQDTALDLFRAYKGDQPSWLFFPVLLPKLSRVAQMDVVHSLRRCEVEASILFPDLTVIAEKLGVSFFDDGHPSASDAANRILTLPCHENMTEMDVNYIVDRLEKIVRD